jgi:hypothetical protein
MGYTSRCKAPTLTPEEQDVAAALRAYSDDPAQSATHADWVPTTLLLRTYRHWLAVHRWRFDPDAPERLTPRQFGRAVRRVFPRVQRCKRSVAARQQYGYKQLVGPESIRSRRLAGDYL